MTDENAFKLPESDPVGRWGKRARLAVVAVALLLIVGAVLSAVAEKLSRQTDHDYEQYERIKKE